MEEKIWGPFVDGLGMELTVKIHYRGLWRIETRVKKRPVSGKATMVIQIRNPKTNQVVDYSPEHSEICEGILEAMLQAELDNDSFVFKKGVYGVSTKRPTQVFDKISQAETKLREWRDKSVQSGLKPPPSGVEDFM